MPLGIGRVQGQASDAPVGYRWISGFDVPCFGIGDGGHWKLLGWYAIQYAIECWLFSDFLDALWTR